MSPSTPDPLQAPFYRTATRSSLQRVFDRIGIGISKPWRADLREHLIKWDLAQLNSREAGGSDPKLGEIHSALALRGANPGEAFARLLALAEAGSVWSMEYVAWAYHNGAGVERDPIETQNWNQRAMKAGSLRALLSCGHHCWTKGDLAGCEEIYGVGAAMGWAPAIYWLARTRLRRSSSKATLLEVRPLLETAMAKGSPAARSTLARLLIRGRFGLREIPSGFKLVAGLSEQVTRAARAERAKPSPD